MCRKKEIRVVGKCTRGMRRYSSLWDMWGRHIGHDTFQGNNKKQILKFLTVNCSTKRKGECKTHKDRKKAREGIQASGSMGSVTGKTVYDRAK